MHTRASAPRTGADRSRLVGLDAARGLALIGMIVVNVGPTDATSLLQRLYLLPYGRASILFVVIAGIGMGYLLGRSRRRPASGGEGRWPVVLWRAGLLVVGGMALQALTDDIGVILALYGILFVLAPLANRLPDRGLTIAAGVMLLVGPILVIVHDLVTGQSPGGSPPVRPDDPPGELALGLLFAGRYPLVTWVVPFLVGLRLARTDLAGRATQRRLVVWGTVAAGGGLAASGILRTLIGPAADEGFTRLLTGVAHGQMPLWLVSSVGGAVAVVALLARLGQARPRLLEPLAAAGRLSLTVYVAHILLLIAVMPAGGFSFPEGIAVSAALVAVAIAFGLVWRRVGGPGPLERVMRAPWARRSSTPARPEPPVRTVS
ncbi:MAG: DUF418 domain-containing protein [Kineosporiaceae bacterium]